MQRLPRISSLGNGVRLRPRPRVGGFENTGVTAAGPRRNGRARNSGAAPSPTQVESNSRPSLRERGVRVTRRDGEDQQTAAKEFIKRKTEVYGAENLKSATLLSLTKNKAKLPNDDKELLERIYASRTDIAGRLARDIFEDGAPPHRIEPGRVASPSLWKRAKRFVSLRALEAKQYNVKFLQNFETARPNRRLRNYKSDGARDFDH